MAGVAVHGDGFTAQATIQALSNPGARPSEGRIVVADTYCSQCGVLLDRPARYCRQCGAPLTPESSWGSAQAQTAEPSGYQPGATLRPPTGVGGDWGSPMGGTLPSPGSPGTIQPPVRRPRWKKILLAVSLFLLLLVGGAAFAAYQIFQRVRTEIGQLQPNDLLRAGEAGPLQDEIDRALREGLSALPDANATPSDDLTPYLYPGATRTQSTRIIGNEMLRLVTADNFDQVDAFYRKLAGNPLAEKRSPDKQQCVYKIPTTPTTIVTIRADSPQSGETRIVLIRSPHLSL